MRSFRWRYCHSIKTGIMRSQLLFGIAICMLTITHLHAQTPQVDPAYIEVTGSAEMEIIPDEIYISVSLSERYDGREKVTLAVQDEKFFNAIKELGIPMGDVQLSDAVTDYSYYKWRKEDALATKDYIVLVHTAEMTSKLFKKLVDIDAENAKVTKVSHSKIEQYRKEVKIKAMKATHEKAEYMLEAIGQELGKPIVITELNENVLTTNYAQYDMNSYRTANFMLADGYTMPAEISFQKIKLKYEIYGKFEIK